MLGAMIGDIVGSRFEWHNYRKKDFTLFTDACEVTDDTIMTLALFEAMMDAKEGEGLPEGGTDETSTAYRNLTRLAVR